MSSISAGLDGITRHARLPLVLLATSLGVLLAQIDTSVVNLALKSTDTDFIAGLRWRSSAAILCMRGTNRPAPRGTPAAWCQCACGRSA